MVSAGFREDPRIGKKFLIWEGCGVLQKKLTRHGVVVKPRIDKSLEEADKAAQQAGCALLWVGSNDTPTTKLMLQSSPELAVTARVLDEAKSSAVEPRNHQSRSCVQLSVLVNATIPSYENTTDGQPTHPLTVALGGKGLDLRDRKHVAIVTLSKSPNWLRALCAEGLAPLMPRGILKLTLHLRLTSLAGRAVGADMQIMSIHQVLKTMLETHCRDARMGSRYEEAKEETIRKCVRTLSNHASDASLADRMVHAIDENTQTSDALKASIMHNAASEPLSESLAKTNKELEQSVLWLGCVRRLLEGVHEAVNYDPPPVCPVLLDEIPPKQIALAPCCGTVFNVTILSKLKTCPTCRAPLSGTLAVADAVASLDVPTKPAPTPPTDDASPFEDDERFCQALTSMASSTVFDSGFKATVAALQKLTRWRCGLRVLLCFRCSTDANSDDSANATCRAIRASVDGLDTVNCGSDAAGRAALDAFKRDDNTNRVFCINANENSNTVAGLDLGNTQVVIFDSVNSRWKLQKSAVIQAIGRAMRPTKLPRGVVADPHAPSSRPPLIMLCLEAK